MRERIAMMHSIAKVIRRSVPVAMLVSTTTVLAQDTQAGRTAEVGGTEVGQRQTRDQAAPNVEPTRRISNRIQNRVQNRIRNRIDRYYDPQANAASPLEIAADQASVADRRAQR